MELQILHDKSAILTFLRKNAEIQIYCIGDLDDFYWPKTIWYGLSEKNSLRSIALFYAGMKTPTLLTFYDKNPDHSFMLLEQIKSILPNEFFAHLSPGLIDIFGKKSICKNFGLHYKMALRRTPVEVNDSNIRRLAITDLILIQDFYSVSYPFNWFDKRMLETGKYFGYFVDNRLAGISGIHVYSKEYKVAALGNIATHPDYRGQQIAFKLTSKLCSDLLRDVDFIALNVNSDNAFAQKCYNKIGFEIVGTYEEYLIRNN